MLQLTCPCGLCAVDECGVCAGSSNCPFEIRLLFDYPYVTPELFQGNSAEQLAVKAELVTAMSLRTSIPPDHFLIQSLQPQNSLAFSAQLELRMRITNGGLNEAKTNHSLAAPNLLPGNTYVNVSEAFRQPGACWRVFACATRCARVCLYLFVH